MISEFLTVSGLSDYERVLTCDGVDYSLRLAWNQRDGHWYGTLRDAAGADIATGVKLVTGTIWLDPLFGDVPPGEFILIDRQGKGSDPGLLDFGDRFRLYYLDAEEIAGL